MIEVWVFVLSCLSANCKIEPDYYSKELYYTEDSCKRAARGTAINLYLAHKKEFSYKCIHPEFEPKEVK